MVIIFLIVAAGALGLKIISPDDAKSHFEAKRGAVDIEQLKQKAAEYDQRTREGRSGTPAAAPAAADPTPATPQIVNVAQPVPALTGPAPTEPARNVASVGPQSGTQNETPLSSASQVQAPSPQAQSAAPPAASGDKFGPSLYLRFPSKVVRLRLNLGLSDEEKTHLESLFAKACLVEEASPSSAQPGCGLQITIAKDADPGSLTLTCDGSNDDCLSTGAPNLKIGSAPAGRSIASDVSIYAVAIRKSGRAQANVRPKIYRTVASDE